MNAASEYLALLNKWLYTQGQLLMVKRAVLKRSLKYALLLVALVSVVLLVYSHTIIVDYEPYAPVLYTDGSEGKIVWEKDEFSEIEKEIRETWGLAGWGEYVRRRCAEITGEADPEKALKIAMEKGIVARLYQPTYSSYTPIDIGVLVIASIAWLVIGITEVRTLLARHSPNETDRVP